MKIICVKDQTLKNPLFPQNQVFNFNVIQNKFDVHKIHFSPKAFPIKTNKIIKLSKSSEKI